MIIRVGGIDISDEYQCGLFCGDQGMMRVIFIGADVLDHRAILITVDLPGQSVPVSGSGCGEAFVNGCRVTEKVKIGVGCKVGLSREIA